MRTAFINQLIEEAKINNKIFLLVGDLGFSVVEKYMELFPDRFLNVGVAEQNMAGIASGLALEGFCVFIYSIGNFPTLRCMEQIRYDIAYHNLNVKIIAVGGGYAYGSLGVSHQATEEIGMLRVIPNLIICSPGDPIETKVVTSYAALNHGPCYIRLGKAGEKIVHNANLEKIYPGQFFKINGYTNSNIAVFASGSILKYTVDFISNNHINADIYSFPFVKPVDQESLLDVIRTHKKIITIEEHQANGGFGSVILEIINDLIEDKKILKSPLIKRIAIRDKFYSFAGSQEYLRKIAGLELNCTDFN